MMELGCLALVLCTFLLTAVAPGLDWLLAVHSPADSSYVSTLRQTSESRSGGSQQLELSNGLVSRRFILEPNFASVDLRRFDTLYSGGGSFFRALAPEATVTLSHDCGRKQMRACSDGNGTVILCEQPFCSTSQSFNVGGVGGQVHYAQRTSASFNPTVNASSTFTFESYTSAPISSYPPRFAWTPGEYNSRRNLPWPPRGVRLNVTFAAPKSSPNQAIRAHVIYELYDALPVFSKWVQFTNLAGGAARRLAIETEITSVSVEMLRVPEHVAPSPAAGTRLMVETDYMPRHTYWTDYSYPSRGAVSGPGSIWGGAYMDTNTWFNDDKYQDDAHDGALCVGRVYPKLLLNVSYPYGPGWLVRPGESFESFRVLELLQDSDDEERQELGRRAMLRTLAPQTTASFVWMMNDGKHPDDEGFAGLMRNASAVGFDAVLSQPYNNVRHSILTSFSLSLTICPVSAPAYECQKCDQCRTIQGAGGARQNAIKSSDAGRVYLPPANESAQRDEQQSVRQPSWNACPGASRLLHRSAALLHPSLLPPALTGVGGAVWQAPKAGVYRGADMATTEHREYREQVVEWIEQTGMQILTVSQHLAATAWLLCCMGIDNLCTRPD
jgi:hypothetical protein